MTNSAAKRTAAQNDSTIKYLQLGLLITTLFSLTIRLVFRIRSLSPTSLSFWFNLFSQIPSFFITRYLVAIGSPKRDESGALISPGEDLSRSGIIEWAFDIVYISWAAQIGSAAFSEWFWWLYIIIPLYAGWKAWSMFLGPYLGFGRSSSAKTEDITTDTSSTSKRQEKFRKRNERGDPRVKSQAVKR